jgi:hypothetical protein
VDLATDALEDVAAVLSFLPEEVPDVLDRRGLDRRRPDDLGRPADALGDLPERLAALADDDPRFARPDDDLAGVRVELHVGDLGLVGDDRPDLLLGTRRRRQHVRIRSDGDPLSQLARELADEIAVARELLGISRVDDQLRPLVGHVGDRDLAGDHLVDRRSHRLELLVYRTHSSDRSGVPDAVGETDRRAPGRTLCSNIVDVIGDRRTSRSETTPGKPILTERIPLR